ncbi:MAG: IS701 family transposase [Chlorobium sp.]
MAKEILFPGLTEYLAPYHPYFYCIKSRETAKCYLAGLMMDGERKSVEPMSVKVNTPERVMQYFLSSALWDEQKVGAEYRHRMLMETSDPQGLFVIDDTGFTKKGVNSACVSRQYCRATGKTDNCQIGTSMTYVGHDVAWPYIMELFVPESWDEDTEACSARRKKTHIPESVHHRTKWQMALDFIDLARQENVPHRAILADSWYGNIPAFRQGLESRKENYFLGIDSDTQIFLQEPDFHYLPVTEGQRGRKQGIPVESTVPGAIRLSVLGASVAEENWQRLELRLDSCGEPLVVETVSMRVWPAYSLAKRKHHEEVWLMVERRSLSKGGYELRYFFSNMPQQLSTLDLAKVYHERYWIEQGYQQLKEELGLDHHEGRSWKGWHRHVLLTFLAYGYLTQVRLHKNIEGNQAARSE